jgi:anion-transporting  ArsA/GET3 family ATPase
MLAAPGTAFLVVAAPESAALREASFFTERLAKEGMPLAGVVINRLHRVEDAKRRPGLGATQASAAAEKLEADGGYPDIAALLRLHAERGKLAAREASLVERFTRAHPDTPLGPVPAFAEDVHDLAGLRAVGAALAAKKGS